MDELVAKRWRKNGKDRLYVNRVGERGPAVAWLDLETGETKIIDPAYATPARQVIAEWLQPNSTRTATAPSPAARIVPLPTSIPPLPPLTTENDLALNRPGAAVKSKVRELEARRTPFVRWIARTLDLSVRGTESWQAGLVGEEAVGDVLTQLGDQGWRVLHAIPWPSGADIDHLVIGPPGVFTINAKHHAGAKVWVGDSMLRVNGRSTDHLRFSKVEAQRVAAVLRHWCGWEVPVQPVVAIVGAQRIIRADGQSPEVSVFQGAELCRELLRLPPRIGHRVGPVFEVARRREVWAAADRRR